MENLGGHDLPSLVEAFEAAARHDRPTLFLAYTIKGRGLPLAGHKDNHAGLMTPAQIEGLRAALGVRAGHEFDPWEGVADPDALAARGGRRRALLRRRAAAADGARPSPCRRRCRSPTAAASRSRPRWPSARS